MRRFALLLACVVALPSSAPAVLVNGSFETPIVPAASYTNFMAPSAAITGWTVVGVDVSVVNTTFNVVGITFQAQDGDQWLDLAGETSNSSLSGVTQDVATSIGTPYVLTFYVGSASDGGTSVFPSTVDVSFEGGPRVGYTNPTAPTNMLNWLQFNVPFVATDTTTTISFFNGSAANNFLCAVDNVSFTAVPEPASMVLALIGFGAAGLRARARRSRAHLAA